MLRLFLLLCVFHFPLFSQTMITGYVRDLQTLEELAAANIQILGTMRGTITNTDGRFQLEIKSLPTTLKISYIGYESKQITLNSKPSKMMDIQLNPIILESEAIIVTAEDPAMNIMRKVIKKKREWREKLETYHAKAYSRLVLENDSGIVSIAESISEAFWHNKKGPREVIKTKRQSSNMNEQGNFATVSYIPNFYDDDIELMGFRIIGPTHPSALDYYRFKLTGRRRIDEKVVYDIEVIPTSRLQPTFVGRLSVLDEEYALLEVDLKPNDTILFPPPIQEWNLYYKQQFNNYGKEYWLPVDVRIEGRIKIGFTGLQFPAISYSQLSHLDDYKINIELPDSLYKEEDVFSVDSTTLAADTLFIRNPEVVPLSVEEQSAYESLDSTMTLDKAFKPTGMLARFVVANSNADREQPDSSGRSWLSGFTPQLWFNRVDGLNLGAKYSTHLTDAVDVELITEYKTGAKRWAFGADLDYALGKSRNSRVKASYRTGTRSQFSSDNYNLVLASIPPLFAKRDYFNYFWSEAWRAEFSRRLNHPEFRFRAGVNHEQHSVLERTTDFNIPGSDKEQRENLPAVPGDMTSFDIQLRYGEHAPLGIVGANHIELKVEHSSSKLLNSDFNFTIYRMNLDWRINTFLRRRLLPNALDIRISLAKSYGTPPVQKFSGIDGTLVFFSPYGTFRTLAGRHYSGEDVAALFWEHNFRTVPFEILGLDYLAKKGVSVIIHGAHGRTWIDNKQKSALSPMLDFSDRTHHETGISINNLFGILRIDGTWRLDRPGFYIGIGLARFF